MADFEKCYYKTLNLEGGYQLGHLRDDCGGQTYAGISRVYHGNWPGWKIIDDGGTPSNDLVMDFFDEHFWLPLSLNAVISDSIAWPIYDFAVTSGKTIAAKTAQAIIGVKQDLIIGPKSIAGLNLVEPDWFKNIYFIRRIRFYTKIALYNNSQRNFLLSWVMRSLEGVCV